MGLILKSKGNAFLSLVVIVIILTLSLPPTVSAQEAVIKEEKRVFKTYPFGDPDPVPKMGRIYPYFRFDGYSHTGQNREWRTVTMENDYIKVLITPEIGGKVWGAVEKSTGRAFVYFNKVVKFRDIAMRGPWTSGGIEFNFGAIGHAPTTSTPVDYIVRNNKDGSVSCILGAMDLSSRTEWRVHVRLPKDKAYFETESSWYNPTPLHHSYYHWMNGGADTGDGLEFYYPGSHHINHDGQAFSWPRDKKGRKISVYKNNTFGPHKSYHVLGKYTEFFGGYWHQADFGFGNWSLYDDKPGKKLWLWALSRQGEIWKDLLTDEGNNQYMEFQSGRLLNQAVVSSTKTPFKHAAFAPMTYDRWNEIWFPVKGAGGMRSASPYGVLNLSVKNGETDGQLHIALCPLQRLDDPLVVTINGKQLLTKPLKLQPMEVLHETLPLPPEPETVEVAVGGDKLRYSSKDEQGHELRRPLRPARDFDWTSAEGLYIKAREAARQRNYKDALDTFLKCLEKEPHHIRALTGAAEIYFRRGDGDKAFSYARRALAVDTYDAAANFIYGLANTQKGRFTDAKDGFGWAARSMEYRSAAYTRLAVLYLRENNLSKATLYARRSLDYNSYNLTGYQIQAVIARLQKDRRKADAYLQTLLNIDPLHHFARFERYLGRPVAGNLSAFKSLIRNEFPHQTYLEPAMTYMDFGQEEAAAAVLEASPSYPIVDYWLAYLYRDKAPLQSAKYLQQALDASPFLVFPFRNETRRVLGAALKAHPHWKTIYYMGLLSWRQGDPEAALFLFKQCEDRPDFAPFYLARAALHQEIHKRKGKPAEGNEAGLRDLRRAEQLDKDEWRTGRALTAFYIETKDYGQALNSARKTYKQHPGNYITAMDYARTLLLTDQYKSCLSVLAKTRILPYEGAREGRNLYRQANLQQAVRLIEKGQFKQARKHIADARRWPEHLGVGKPYDTDEKLEDYLDGLCGKRSKNTAKAREKIGKLRDK